MSDHPDDPRLQMRGAIARATTSPAAQRRKLLLWCFRQALLGALAWYFWDRPWMRWVFWIGVSVALINLAMILLMPKFLAAQQRRGTAAMDRLDALGREDRSGEGGPR